MPNHLTARSLERPLPRVPTRAEAMAVWESTQDPERTARAARRLRRRRRRSRRCSRRRQDRRPVTPPPRRSVHASFTVRVSRPMVAPACVPPIDVARAGGRSAVARRRASTAASARSCSEGPQQASAVRTVAADGGRREPAAARSHRSRGTNQLSELVMAAVRQRSPQRRAHSLQPVAAMQRCYAA
jgi:hypothetical protein